MKQLFLSFIFAASIAYVYGQRIVGTTPISLAKENRALEELPQGLIWYQGFDNSDVPYLPAGFSTFSIGDNGFRTGAAGDDIGQTNENGYWPVPLHGLFAFTNDDLCNCDKSADRITSPVIDLSRLNDASFGFSAFQNGSGGQMATVQFKSPNGNWNDVMNIKANATWQNLRIAIDEVYLHSAFQFRFRYDDNQTYASGLALDDLFVSSQNSGKFGVDEFFTILGEQEGSGYLCYQIPETQARAADWVFGAAISNESGTPKNAELSIKISGPVGFDDTSSQWLVSKNSASTVRFDHRTTFSPYSIGDYNLRASLLTDSIDESDDDNFFETDFSVVDSTYQRVEFKTDGTGIVITNQTDRVGTVFELYAGDTVRSVNVSLHQITTVGARFRIKFFDYNTLTGSIFTSSTTEVLDGEPGKEKRVQLNHFFPAGKYLVVVEKESGTLVINSNSRSTAPFGLCLYQPFGQSWRHLAYYPFMNIIMPAVDSVCSGHIQSIVKDESCLGVQDGIIKAEVLNANFPWTYNWSSSAGNVDEISNLSAGPYQLIVSDGLGCIYTEEYLIQNGSDVTINPAISPDSCAKSVGTAQLNVSGGFLPYQILFDGTQSSENISGFSAGTHDIQITDDHGCALDSQIVVEGTSLINLGVSITKSGCNTANGKIVATPNGTFPFQFNWNTGSANDTLDSLVSGIYKLTVYDSLGCASHATIYLNDSNSPSLSVASIENETCFAQANGSIFINANGGTLPVTYEWSNSTTANPIGNLSAGTYSVTVTDFVGCKNFLVNEIENESDRIQVHLIETGINCFGLPGGSIQPLIQGGAQPFTYNWSNGTDLPTAIGLSAGNYGLTITDDFGCTAEIATELFARPRFFILLDSVQKKIIDSTTVGGSIYTSSYGGTPPYQFLWNSGWRKANYPNADTGINVLTVTDQLGCTQQIEVFIGEYPLGLNNKVSSSDLKIYPNPLQFGQPLQIQSFEPFTKIELLAINGKLLQRIDPKIELIQLEIAAGTYILVTSDFKGKTNFSKLVVTP